MSATVFQLNLVQRSSFAQPAKQTALSKAFTVKNKCVLKIYFFLKKEQIYRSWPVRVILNRMLNMLNLSLHVASAFVGGVLVLIKMYKNRKIISFKGSYGFSEFLICVCCDPAWVTESINSTGMTGGGTQLDSYDGNMLLLVWFHQHNRNLDNNEPMPKHVKCSAFNEHRIFISYTSQHWIALIKKCKYRFLTHSSLTRGLNYLQYNPQK